MSEWPVAVELLHELVANGCVIYVQAKIIRATYGLCKRMFKRAIVGGRSIFIRAATMNSETPEDPTAGSVSRTFQSSSREVEEISGASSVPVHDSETQELQTSLKTRSSLKRGWQQSSETKNADLESAQSSAKSRKCVTILGTPPENETSEVPPTTSDADDTDVVDISCCPQGCDFERNVSGCPVAVDNGVSVGSLKSASPEEVDGSVASGSLSSATDGGVRKKTTRRKKTVRQKPTLPKKTTRRKSSAKTSARNKKGTENSGHTESSEEKQE